MSVIVNLNPESEDTPYLLFSLKTRSQGDITEHFGSEITLVFIRDEAYNRFNAKLINGDIYQESMQKNIDTFKKIIDYWMLTNNDMCLFLDPYQKQFKLDGIPSSWVRDMVPLINIRNHDNKIEDGKLYIKLEPKADYIKTYDSLSIKMLNFLKERYTQGFTYGYGKIAAMWGLKDLGHGYHKPMWSDSRFAPNIVTFLTQRFLEIDARIHNISIYLHSSNRVIRHFITKNLGRMPKFAGTRMIVNVANLNEAIALADNVFTSSSEAFGIVDLSVHKKKPSITDGVIYMTNDIKYPYTVSRLKI